jgi:hypothetical protein
VRIERRVRREARDRLDAGGHVLVALADLDRMEGHPQGLQRGRAEAVDGRGRDVVVEPGQQRCVAADVVARLAHLEAAAHHHVVGLGEVDARVALDQRPQGHGGEVVGADVLQRPLGRAPDRRADGVDDHGFRHRKTAPWFVD